MLRGFGFRGALGFLGFRGLGLGKPSKIDNTGACMLNSNVLQSLCSCSIKTQNPDSSDVGLCSIRDLRFGVGALVAVRGAKFIV